MVTGLDVALFPFRESVTPVSLPSSPLQENGLQIHTASFARCSRCFEDLGGHRHRVVGIDFSPSTPTPAGRATSTFLKVDWILDFQYPSDTQPVQTSSTNIGSLFQQAKI
jgi:hypothetical protein